MNVNISMGNVPQNKMFAGGMLKSTQDRMERAKERDNQVAFFENRISMLKGMKTDSLEDIGRKLELLQSYKDGINAAKQAYNNQQMFHIMDEARERAEKIAEAAEKMKPKTAEELKEEIIEEATGSEDQGVLSEVMEELTEMVEEMTEEMLEKTTENMTEAMSESTEVFSEQDADEMSAMSVNAEQNMLQAKGKLTAYKPVDYYV